LSHIGPGTLLNFLLLDGTSKGHAHLDIHESIGGNFFTFFNPKIRPQVITLKMSIRTEYFIFKREI
jgi:hypothetical protein